MKILVAYAGGTEIDKAVLALAKKNAKLFNATLYIANSMESASEKEFDDLTKIESKLETLKASLTKEGIPCETHLLIRGLSPGEDIVEFAKDKNIDQIFIGIEKKSKVGKLFFGSNAQHIILEAPCPVVSVNKKIF
jgi:Universal stress protein UspA and related nucleotide-binding proteins